MNKYLIAHYILPVMSLLLFCHTNLSAQYAKFEYETELCNCKAQFDTTKYSRQQLQNTFEYLYNNLSIMNTDPFDFDEDPALLLASLEKERKQKLESLKQSNIVSDAFWQRERVKMIKYINSTCELMRVTILARLDPKELLNYKLVDNTCKYFRNALIAGGDQLLKAWTALNEMQKKNNGSPENVQQSFENKYNSPQKLQHALKEVLMYGWWNSANNLLPHINQKGYEKNFNRLLKDIQCECDEP